MTTDVLAMIDGALADYETGADAMRWAPPDARAPEPPSCEALQAEIDRAAAVIMPQFGAAMTIMARAIDAFAPIVQAMARDFARLMPAVKMIAEARREGTSAMHREYARRQRARRRRR